MFATRIQLKQILKDKYNAIFQIPKLVSAVEIIQKTTDEIFQRIEMLSDVKAGTFYSPNDKYRSLTIHRTRAVESARTQMAAEEHFDFLTANVYSIITMMGSRYMKMAPGRISHLLSVLCYSSI